MHDVDGRRAVVSASVDPAGLPPLLLAAIDGAGVVALTSTPPTLEELFLDAYRSDAVSNRLRGTGAAPAVRAAP